MPPALTPALALDYVRELSADVRAVIILGADERALAGPEALAPAARDVLAAAGAAAEVEAVTPDGVVCAVRAPGRAAVAVCGRHALPGVVRHDLRVALAALAGEAGPPPAPAPGGPAGAALQAAAETLISAAQRHSEA